MKKYTLLVLCISLAVFHAQAQIPDNSVENLMSRRVLSYEEIRYNTVSLIPRLYKENKTDTLNAVIAYYEKKVPSSGIVVPFDIIRRIKERRFTEELKHTARTTTTHEMTDKEYYEANIFAVMNLYIDFCKVKTDTQRYDEDVRKTYGDYFDFLQSLAQTELGREGLTNVEKFLLAFFATPSDKWYERLSYPEYNNTVIQAAWMKYKKKRNAISGLDYGLIAGAWIPTGNATILGSHPVMGFYAGVRKNKVTVDAEISLRFLRAPKNYLVTYDNNVYATDYYLGGYIGVNGSYELYRTKRHEFDALAGIAYDGFDAFSGDNSNNSNNNSPNKSINSYNFNLGAGYLYFLKRKTKRHDIVHSYIGLQVKYNITDYQNNGGTNLNGNAWTVNLVLGGISLGNNGRKSGW